MAMLYSLRKLRSMLYSLHKLRSVPTTHLSTTATTHLSTMKAAMITTPPGIWLGTHSITMMTLQPTTQATMWSLSARTLGESKLWPNTDDGMSTAPSLHLPSCQTPLYSALLEKLSDCGDEDRMEKLSQLFVCCHLKNQRPYGSAEQPDYLSSTGPYALGLRVEHLLSVTLTQRSQHIARLASRNDRRAQWNPDELVFSSEDMKEVMNTWREQPETWMNPQSYPKVVEMPPRVVILSKNQDIHQTCNFFLTRCSSSYSATNLWLRLLLEFPYAVLHSLLRCSDTSPRHGITTISAQRPCKHATIH